MENKYRTKDFYGCCLLRALGFHLFNIDRNPNNVCSFVFEDPDQKASQIIHEYWDKKILVDARTLIDAINEMKTRLYAKQ